MVDSAWAWSATVRRPVRGLGGPGPPPEGGLIVLSRKNIQRNKTCITNVSATLGPLGVSGLFLSKPKILNIFILCQLASRNKISTGNYITW